MARRRGGFGGGGWLGDAGGSAPAAGPATAPTRRSGGGGGSGRHKIQSAITQRERKQEKRQKKRDDGIVDPTVEDDGLSGLDENQMDLAFEDPNPDTLRLGALGMLERAGINTGPGATDAQRGFIEDTVGSWVDQHLGDTLVNDPNASWGGFMDDMVVTPEEKAAQAAALDPTAEAVLADPEQALSYADWANDTMGLNKNELEDLKKKKRQRLKGRYQTYADEFAPAEDPNDGLAPDAGAGENDWVWNEGIRQKLTLDWAKLNPHQRGYNSAEWVAPKRTIQF